MGALRKRNLCIYAVLFSSVQFILFPHGHLSQPQAVLPQVRAYKNSYITNSTRTYHTIGVHIKYNRMSNKQNNNKSQGVNPIYSGFKENELYHVHLRFHE